MKYNKNLIFIKCLTAFIFTIIITAAVFISGCAYSLFAQQRQAAKKDLPPALSADRKAPAPAKKAAVQKKPVRSDKPAGIFMAGCVLMPKKSHFTPFEAAYYLSLRFKKNYGVAGILTNANAMPLINEFGEIFEAAPGKITLRHADTCETVLTGSDGFFVFQVQKSVSGGEKFLKYTDIAGISYESAEVKLDKNKNYLIRLFICGGNKVKILTAPAAGRLSAEAPEIFKRGVLEQTDKLIKRSKKITSITGRVESIRPALKDIEYDESKIKNESKVKIDKTELDKINKTDKVKLILLPDKKEITPDKSGYFKFGGNLTAGRRQIIASAGDNFEKTTEIKINKFDYGFSYDGVIIKFNSTPLISNLAVNGNSNDITVSFDLFDEDSDECALSFRYSVDNGKSYKTSENITAAISTPGFFGLNGFRHKLIWRSREDIVDNPGGVIIELSASDKKVQSIPVYSRAFPIRNNNRPALFNVIISGASDEITINYDLSDIDNNTCSVSMYYSENNGLNFIKTESISGDINFVTPMAAKKIIWRSRDNIKNDSHNVVIKLIAFDGVEESQHYISPAVSVFNNFSRPEIEIKEVKGDSNEIMIGYSLCDSDENTCLVEMSYSLDSKRFMRSISVSGDISGVKPGEHRNIKWNSRNDLKLDTKNLFIELTAFDGTGYGNKSVYGPLGLNNNRPPDVMNIYPADVSGEIVIYYDIIDEESDTCSVDFYYSIDNGLTFNKNANITGEIYSVRPGVRRFVKWKTRPELNGDYDGVKVKIAAAQHSGKYGKYCISPPFSIRNNRAPGAADVFCGGGSDEIEVKFCLTDADNHGCTVEVYYSLDEGTNFIKTNNIIIDEKPLKPGRSKTLRWLSHRDFHTSEDKVKLKIIPFDNYARGYEAVSGLFNVSNNEAPVISNIVTSGEGGSISISYDLYDFEGNTCEVKLWYLIPGAAEFVKSVNISGDCRAVNPGAARKIIWNSTLDFTRDYDGVIIKLTADDGNLKSAGSVSPTFKVFNNRPPEISDISLSANCGDISINYNIYDDDGDDCAVEFQYSIDGGAKFNKTKNISGDLKRVKPGAAPKLIKWSSASDFLSEYNDVFIKLTAFDKSGAGKESVFGPFTVDNKELCSVSDLRVKRDDNDNYIINYDLKAYNGNLCTIEVYYSLDGQTFNETDRATDIRGEIVNVKSGVNKKIIWDPSADLMMDSKLYIKLSPIDKKARGGASISTPFKVNTAMSEVKLMPEVWPREGHTHLCNKGRMFIIGGWAGSPNYYNDVTAIEYDTASGSSEVFISPNHYSSVRHSHSGAVYDDKLWVIGGFFNKAKNDAWYSADGTTWVEITKNETESVKFTMRDSHASVVFDDGFGDKLFVIGGFSSGYKNDVWCSVTGAQWTCITGETSFSPRVGHGAAVFKNNIYLIGGYDGAGYKNDVWRSTDGIRWEMASGAAGFDPRRGHAVVVFKDKLWVIGGYGENEKYYNDIWCSSDGSSWRQIKTPSAENGVFSPRRGHSAVVYKDKLWIFGGYGGTSYMNDLWRSR